MTDTSIKCAHCDQTIKESYDHVGPTGKWWHIWNDSRYCTETDGSPMAEPRKEAT